VPYSGEGRVGGVSKIVDIPILWIPPFIGLVVLCLKFFLTKSAEGHSGLLLVNFEDLRHHYPLIYPNSDILAPDVETSSHFN
jgi:hypothetical protein